jgi:hypothetical protein
MPMELITDGLVLQPIMCSSSRRSAICTSSTVSPSQADFKEGMAGRHHRFPALPCPALERQTDRGHCLGYDGNGAAALCGIKEAGGITHCAEV